MPSPIKHSSSQSSELSSYSSGQEQRNVQESDVPFTKLTSSEDIELHSATANAQWNNQCSSFDESQRASTSKSKSKGVLDRTKSSFSYAKNEFEIELDRWKAQPTENAEQANAREIAAEKILKTWNNKANRLDLTGLQLSSLPDCIGKFKNIEVLLVEQNQLNELPQSIRKLSKLKILSCHSNQLKSLPDSVGNLSKLEELYLDLNQVSSLPHSLGNLSNLRILSCHGNQLKSLPESVANLHSLETLYLGANQLSFLPNSLGNLRKLKILFCNGNQLKSLPESIGDLSELEVLYLFDNHLNVLPESIGKLSELEVLDCNNNRLESIQNSISNLFNLEVLNYKNNQLKSIPNSLSYLPSLINLDLENNQITELPETIGSLYNLETLYLGQNRLASIPDSIENLTNLVTLDLEKNQLTYLPDSLRMLKLSSLNLQDNRDLAILPSWITELPHECIVDLYGTQIPRSMALCLQEVPECPILWISTSQIQRLLHSEARPIEEAVIVWLSRDPSASFSSVTETWVQWVPFNSEPNAPAFSTFLDRLNETADAQNLNTWQFFCLRVNTVLSAIRDNSTLRNVCFHIANESMETCGDRIALGLQNMELMIASNQARSLGISDLIRVGKQFFRLSALQNIVNSRVRSVESRDEEIETHLVYQLDLKESLDLPLHTNNMLFRTAVLVTKDDIRTARESIISQENGPAMLAFFVDEFTSWREYLEQNYQEDFLQVNKSFADKEEKLAIMPEHMTEGEYIKEVNSLVIDKDTALRNLRMRLTKTILPYLT